MRSGSHDDLRGRVRRIAVTTAVFLWYVDCTKSSMSKTLFRFILVAVVGLLAILLVWAWWNLRTTEPLVTPIEQVELDESLSEGDLSFDVIKGSFVVSYAVKEGTTVTVYNRFYDKDDIRPDGEPLPQFSYEETVPAELSGNLWMSLPPSIAMSPDGNSWVFAAEDGLKIASLWSAGAPPVETLIQKIQDTPEGTEGAPTWSVDGMEGVYLMAQPLWSADGSTISFMGAWYEGSTYGFVDVEGLRESRDDAFWSVKIEDEYALGSTPFDFVWSPVVEDGRFAKTSESGYSPMGLYVSDETVVHGVVNLAERFDRPSAYYDQVNYSSDGEPLVFLTKESNNADDEVWTLAMVNIDGSGYEELMTAPNIHEPMFNADASGVFFLHEISGQTQVEEYVLGTGAVRTWAVLPVTFGDWFDLRWEEVRPGLLSAVGVSPQDASTTESQRSFVLFDLEQAIGEVLFTSSAFTTFLDVR